MNIRNAILKKHFEKCGFDDEFFSTYESKADDKIQNIEELCEKLHHIRCSRQRIVIYTDFDVDGIMSSVIAYAGLSELGFDVCLFRPDPSAGYGFRIEDVDEILNEFPDVNVILTADVGITCNEAIKCAKEKGLSVLVTDHHTNTEPCFADIAVDPNQLGETYSHNYVCGSYVIYSVLELYSKKYCSSEIQSHISRLSMFAGIATISDVMPLMYENRQLVRDSVSLMRYIYQNNNTNIVALNGYSMVYIQAFIGMKKLLDYFSDLRRIKKAEDIDEQFFSFYLVPFLNSCKRMDGDMNGIYDIFFGSRIEAEKNIIDMLRVINGIKYIEELNDKRKKLTSKYFAFLFEEKNKNATPNAKYMQCGIYITDAPAGLLGLLCTKFMAVTGLPTIVLKENGDGTYMGSGRSPKWFDYIERMKEYGMNIVCTGHKEAFGVDVTDKKVFDDYVDFFHNIVQPEYNRSSSKKDESASIISIAYKACCDCDFIYDNTVVIDFMDEMQLYKPYGYCFPEPRFEYCIKLDSNFVKERTFGRNNQHVKLITLDGTEILFFNLAGEYKKIRNNKDDKSVLICSGVFKRDTFKDDKVNFYVNDIKVRT